MGRYWLAEQEMKRNCLVSIEKKKKKMKVNLGELERKHKCSYGYETIAIPVDGKILASIIAELRLARAVLDLCPRLSEQKSDEELVAAVRNYDKATKGTDE